MCRISDEVFIKALIKGRLEGKSNAEIAAQFPITLGSFQVRISKLQKELQTVNPRFKFPTAPRNRQTKDLKALCKYAQGLMSK